MNNLEIAEIKEKLKKNKEWTEEDKKNEEIFGFLAMTIYKSILSDYTKEKYFSKYYINILQQKTSKSLKEFMTRESLKSKINLESSLGKKFSGALAFVLLFPNIKLSNNFQRGCILAETMDIFDE